MTMTTSHSELQRVIQRFQAVPVSDGWKGICPLCGHHSLSISQGDKQPVIGCCFRCHEEGRDAEVTKHILEAANSGVPVSDVYIPPKRAKRSHSEEELWAKLATAQKELDTDRQALDLLESRGISIETAKTLQLGSGYFYGCRRLVIPYFDGVLGERLIQLRYRQLDVPRNPDGSENKDHKWKSEKVERGIYRLFNLPLLRDWSPDNTDPLVVTESELDAMMLLSMGIAAVSVDSAKHKLTDEDRALLLRVKNRFFALDQDQDGFDCTDRFMLSMPGSRHIGGYGPVAKDLGDLRKVRLAQGKDFLQGLRQLLDEGMKEASKEPTLTDAGNGERFVRANVGTVRFCRQRDKIGWFAWDGQRWKPDSVTMAMEYARKAAADIATKAAEDFGKKAISREEFEERLSFSMKSLSDHKLAAMLSQASKGTVLSLEGSAFDAHPELLNLQNGTLNLNTGESYRARQEDLLTQVMNVSYDPSARCPMWTRYLDGVTQGDEEMMGYLQRVFGYLLTGRNGQSEQCSFVFYGPGGTGKTTFWVTMQGLLGDYFMMAPAGLFLKKNRFSRPNGQNASPGLHMMVGKRVVATTEMEEGDKFDAGLLKQITGGETVTALPLYAPFFTFQPQCVPVFLTNFIPGTEDFSGAMEQRLRIVKFERVFRGTGDEIKGLTKMLVAEYPGILNWALAGLAAWQDGGLRDPHVVTQAVKEYVADENAVVRWMKARTTPDKHGEVTPPDAFASFKRWAEEADEYFKGGGRWFSLRMAQLGFKSEPDGNHTRRAYKGFMLRDAADKQEFEIHG